MRKRVLRILLLAAAAVMLAGCRDKAGEEKSPSQVSREESDAQGEEEGSAKPEKDSSRELEHLAKDGEYSLAEAALLPGSRLLLFYNRGREYQFKIYDLKDKRITGSSEPIQLEEVYRSLEKLRVLSDYFYIIAQNTCYVYDFSCQLARQAEMPVQQVDSWSSITYGLSNDLERMAYVKRMEDGREALYLCNGEGRDERLLCELDTIMIQDIFFSTDNRCLGIKGSAFPEGEDSSVDAYGYMDLDTDELRMLQEDDTFVSHVGDVMLIPDRTGEYGGEKGGKVRILDLRTREVQEIVMKFPDECERASLGSDPEYMVGMHSEEKELAFSFTIYRNGEALTTVPYACSSQPLFMDIGSSPTKMELDVETKQILLFYDDTESGCYTIKTIPYDL